MMMDTMLKMKLVRRFEGDLVKAGVVMINRCMMRVMTARAAAHLKNCLNDRIILQVMSGASVRLS
jgi:hypothetical protein